MKVCKACGDNLANAKFGRDNRTKDNLSPNCYKCRGVLELGATEKRCIMCLEDKDLEEFHRDMQSSDNYRRICKKCGITQARSWNKHNKEVFAKNVNEWRKANRAATKETQRKSHLKKTYNLTVEEYWSMFDSQGGVCLICHAKPGRKHLSVDHDHGCCKGKVSCGKCVRGLLCQNCNRRILPIFEHDPDALDRLANYVSKTLNHQKKAQ